MGNNHCFFFNSLNRRSVAIVATPYTTYFHKLDYNNLRYSYSCFDYDGHCSCFIIWKISLVPLWKFLLLKSLRSFLIRSERKASPALSPKSLYLTSLSPLRRRNLISLLGLSISQLTFTRWNFIPNLQIKMVKIVFF